VAKSAEALAQVVEALAALNPDVLVVVTAHGDAQAPTQDYALLQGATLPYDFSSLGDLVTQGALKGAVGFTHHLKEQLETRFPIPLVSIKALPYSFAIPVIALGQALSSKPVVCLQVPEEIKLDDLNTLGGLLQEAMNSTKQRVVVLAAGDLAHAKPNTTTEAKIFDQLFQVACEESSLEKLMNLDPNLRHTTHECLQAPACFLYRLLEGTQHTTKLISYEAPVGVGLLVAQVSLG
jgi:aromatic ring-opening dioxygenase LigB subunit